MPRSKWQTRSTAEDFCRVKEASTARVRHPPRGTLNRQRCVPNFPRTLKNSYVGPITRNPPSLLRRRLLCDAKLRPTIHHGVSRTFKRAPISTIYDVIFQTPHIVFNELRFRWRGSPLIKRYSTTIWYVGLGGLYLVLSVPYLFLLCPTGQKKEVHDRI